MTNPNLTLSIVALVERRREELGISRTVLISRMRFKHLTKGRRLLDELYEGQVHRWRPLVEPLARALQVTADVVARAMSETETEIRAAIEAECRARFKPHAIILCEHRPNSMMMAAFAGADRRLRIDFHPDAHAIKYAQEAKAETSRRKDDFLLNHFYGPPMGFVVNYTPDYAVRFQLDGYPAAAIERALERDQVSLSIAGRPLSQRQIDILVGGGLPTA